MTRNLWLALLLAGVAAVWMSAGGLHDYDNADSVLLALVSLQRWTPFYWEQNRFGMLVPLLAVPVRHPLANLIIQGWLTTVSALLAPYLVARCLTNGKSDWWGPGTLANALLVVFAPRAVQFDWFVTQPYALSISLAFGGLLAVESRSAAFIWTIGVALMILAHWVNVGVFLLVVPTLVVTRRLTGRSLSAAAIGMTTGLVFAGFSSAPHTTAGIAPFSTWPHGWAELIARTTASAIAHPAWLALLAVTTMVLALVVAVSRRVYAPIWAAGAAIALAVEYWLAVGGSKWVELNVYLPRYLYPSLMLLGVSLSILLVSPLAGRLAKTPVIAFVLAVMMVYGLPSTSRLRHHIDADFSRLTPEILATQARVISGDYWTVWPSVFDANLALYERTGRIAVYGLTYRSAETDQLWCGAEDVMLAAASQDRAVGVFADRIGLPLRFLEHKTSIDLFAAGPCPNREEAREK